MFRWISLAILLTLVMAGEAFASDDVVIGDGRANADGTIVHDVRSPYQAGVTTIRVLLPDRLDKTKAFPVVYVLPVEARDEKRFGDGLLEVKKNDLANKFQAIFVAPTFSHLPWYADHPTNPLIRQETYLLKVVLPFIEQQYPARHDAGGRLLLGFSKSGWGAYSLLLRHPDLFGRAVAWDAPLMMDQPGKYGSGEIFGTVENFKSYQISKLLEQRAAELQSGHRLGLLGRGNFIEEHRRAHELMQTLKIDHAYTDVPPRKHEWGSGWVPDAVAFLFEPTPATAPTTAPATQPRAAMELKAVRTFMYQIDKLEEPGAIERLAKSDYDLLVVEPTATIRDNAKFDMAGMVAKLHAGKLGRIVLAYLDAGQAESFRTYWKRDWRPPTKTARGNPDFILIPDPDGWSDDYVVAYWDPRWQQAFATDKDSQVRAAMAAGFDGVYLDWIDAYDEDNVMAEARRQRVDPTRAMVDFLLLIRKTAREINPSAIVVQQNAIDLLDADPRLLDAIDALGVEDTWFSGKANAKWGTREAGDIPNRERDESSTAGRLKQYAKYRKAGKPVLTIDYCLNPQNAAAVYKEARQHDLVPLVSQVSLDHMTTTRPPP